MILFVINILHGWLSSLLLNAWKVLTFSSSLFSCSITVIGVFCVLLLYIIAYCIHCYIDFHFSWKHFFNIYYFLKYVNILSYILTKSHYSPGFICSATRRQVFGFAWTFIILLAMIIFSNILMCSHTFNRVLYDRCFILMQLIPAVLCLWSCRWQHTWSIVFGNIKTAFFLKKTSPSYWDTVLI